MLNRGYSSTCAMTVHTQADQLLSQLLMDSLYTLLLHYHGGKSKGTTCVVDRDVSAYMVVDQVLRFSDRVVRLSIRSVYML